MESTPHAERSGFVAVEGRPNVGKSTLINSLVGQKIAAVSAWPQTTRKRQMGILTLAQGQIIFIDTPGIHKPLHKLGGQMNSEAIKVLEECDLGLLLVDLSSPPTEEDHILADVVSGLKRSPKTILVLNKVDTIDETILRDQQTAFLKLFPQVKEAIPISATHRVNFDLLIERILTSLPENPPFFPDDQLTDLYEREIAADLIREAVLNHLRDEVPHSVAVRIDDYKERNENSAYIAATLFSERESQKGIIIGQGGKMLKKIGTAARFEIEAMSGRRIHLQLRVKVRKNWRNDEASLKLFGFSQPS